MQLFGTTTKINHPILNILLRDVGGGVPLQYNGAGCKHIKQLLSYFASSIRDP